MADMTLFRMVMEDGAAFYPSKYHKLRLSNAGVFINVLVSMVRRFIPSEIYDKFELVSHTDVRLDEICLVPNAETAEKRVFRNLTESLRRRFENERAFRLG